MRARLFWLAFVGLVALLPFQVGCADLWGFDDLTLGVDASARDGGAPLEAGADAGTDATATDDASPGDDAASTCADGKLNDILNCGGCGNACDITRSLNATCEPSDAGAWSCHYKGCAAGLEDCDTSGGDLDGCETSMTSTSSCGACGIVCDTTRSIGASCAVGSNGIPSCQYQSCQSGFADCDVSAPDLDGCETSIKSPTNCGACGVACDTKHSTGATCPDGKTCQYTACAANYVDCMSDAPDTDGCESVAQSNSCSACGGACDTAQSNFTTCDTSAAPICQYSSCKAGFKDCNPTPPDTNGCETAVTTTTNCGDCGVACDTAHSAGASCASGACAYTGCASGFLDCLTQAPNTNGCESSTSSITSCGACNVACNTKTGAAKCNGTTCSYKCNAGSSDCNAATTPDTDGCECATPGCCGTGCQTTHTNGVGASYYDCTAKGTQNEAQAMAACEASAGAGHCTGSSLCCLLSALNLCVGTTAQSVCGVANGACYCWQWSGKEPGHVETGSASACTASCGSSSDPTWN